MIKSADKISFRSFCFCAVPQRLSVHHITFWNLPAQFQFYEYMTLRSCHWSIFMGERVNVNCQNELWIFINNVVCISVKDAAHTSCMGGLHDKTFQLTTVQCFSHGHATHCGKKTTTPTQSSPSTNRIGCRLLVFFLFLLVKSVLIPIVESWDFLFSEINKLSKFARAKSTRCQVLFRTINLTPSEYFFFFF